MQIKVAKTPRNKWCATTEVPHGERRKRNGRCEPCMPRQGRRRLRVWCHTAGELYEEEGLRRHRNVLQATYCVGDATTASARKVAVRVRNDDRQSRGRGTASAATLTLFLIVRSAAAGYRKARAGPAVSTSSTTPTSEDATAYSTQRNGGSRKYHWWSESNTSCSPSSVGFLALDPKVEASHRESNQVCVFRCAARPASQGLR